jgi:hypothetical protein
MAGPRFQHTAAPLPGGRVLVAGGFAFGRELETAEIFDPATGLWTPAPPMSEVRQAPTATALEDGRVLLAGGFNFCCSIATAEVYDPRTGAWSPAGAMGVPRGSYDAVLLKDGRVLVAGGLVADEMVFDSTASAEVYDPRSNSWHRVADMSESRIDAGLTVLRNGHVLVSGGFQTPDFASIAHAEILDPRSEDWAPTAPLNLARGSHLSQLLFDGSVLVVGGDPNAEFPTATAEVFRLGKGHRD